MALAGNGMDLLLAGTNGGGVFFSADGQSWQPVNDGLTNNRIFSLTIHPRGHTFAGTNGSGVFASFGGITTTVPLPALIPEGFSLEQNFPNPFNPDTGIHFRLPQKHHVKLTIFNLLGEKVRTLIDGDYPAGNHEVRWDGKDDSGNPTPTGLYVYRLRAGEYSQARKMSLVR